MRTIQTLDLNDTRTIIDAGIAEAERIGNPMNIAVTCCRGSPSITYRLWRIVQSSRDDFLPTPLSTKLQPRSARPLCRSHFRGRCGKMVSSPSRKRVQSHMCGRTAPPPISFFPTLSLRHSTRHFLGHATAVHSRCFSVR